MIDMIGMMFIGAKGHAVKRILLMLLMSAVCVVHASCHYFIFPNFKARAKISLYFLRSLHKLFPSNGSSFFGGVFVV